MKLDVRAKLFFVSLALMALSVLAAEMVLRPTIEQNLVDRITSDLFVRLALVQRAGEGLTTVDPAAWDRLADELGPRASGRITFIAADGRVLGDSEVALAALPALENHKERPEVSRALSGEPRSSMRWSATVHERLMYAAVPLRLPDGTVGAARLAVPLEEVDAAVRRLRALLGVALIVALVVAVIMSTVAAQWLSRPLRQMTETARRMSSGDLTVRTRISGADQVAELAAALDGLAGSLSRTLGELKGERDLLGGILESMREGVLVLDAGQRILLVNPALRSMLLLGSDVGGKAPLELVRNAELQTLLDEAYGQGASASGEIGIGGLKPRRLLVHVTPLGPQGEQRGGLLAVFVDVTDIRRLETLRRDFVANVSHELRTPVAAVCSAVETLRQTVSKDPAASARFIDMIERNAQRLRDLLEDLLSLSRIESREYRPELGPMAVTAAIDQVLAMLRERIERRRLRVSVDVAPELPPVLADPRAVEQILTNLVDNAIKYCPNATLLVRAVGEGRGVRVSVQDDGPGVEPRHIPRLFERFYRVDAGRSRDTGGTGLGLSIVKHLVEAMNGTVGVDSTPGEGSVFWFVLPTPPPAPVKAAAPEEGPDAPPAEAEG
ncbi:MAG TPA: ATP-binding protein [Polyangia bacterium]|nr:ATP-binding protein [Polyangia bacterium]